MERKKIIVVTPEERDWLIKKFEVSNTTVWHALKYHRDHEIHRKIRKAAIERGGQQMVLSPEFDTIYITNRQDVDGTMTRYMIQAFENGSVVEGCFRTGLLTIRNNRGEVVYTCKSPLPSEMKRIQEMALSL